MPIPPSFTRWSVLLQYFFEFLIWSTEILWWVLHPDCGLLSLVFLKHFLTSDPFNCKINSMYLSELEKFMFHEHFQIIYIVFYFFPHLFVLQKVWILTQVSSWTPVTCLSCPAEPGLLLTTINCKEKKMNITSDWAEPLQKNKNKKNSPVQDPVLLVSTISMDSKTVFVQSQICKAACFVL